MTDLSAPESGQAGIGLSTGAEPDRVGPYLALVLDDERWASCTVALISGGKSNLTYLVASPAGEVVLRRPPLAGGLPSAHDMGREHRVLSALADTPVPVPPVRHLCTDDGVLGAPFYVMDRVRGHVIRDELPPGYAETAAEREAMSAALIDVLVRIHAVPVDGALAGYGRPDGYLERQMRRWTGQWERSKAAELPELDRLAAELSAGIPPQRETALVHGDYRLDNTMLDPHDPGRVAAVLDWELSTLGDPLADLGLLCVYWAGRTEGSASGSEMVVPTVTTLPGFLPRPEVVARYAAASGRDVSDLPWYVAFGYFKLAVISVGIASRVRQGGMLGPGFETAGAAVPLLVASGHQVLSSRTLA